MASFLGSPYSPVNPSLRVGVVDSDEDTPLITLIIRPNAVNRCAGKGITVDQTTGIGFIVRIVLNDFSLKDAEEDFIERKLVGLGFLVSVVRNPYSVMTYRINDVFDSHGLPFR
jgi:hypothetical protein